MKANFFSISEANLITESKANILCVRFENIYWGDSSFGINMFDFTQVNVQIFSSNFKSLLMNSYYSPSPSLFHLIDANAEIFYLNFEDLLVTDYFYVQNSENNIDLSINSISCINATFLANMFEFYIVNAHILNSNFENNSGNSFVTFMGDHENTNLLFFQNLTILNNNFSSGSIFISSSMIIVIFDSFVFLENNVNWYDVINFQYIYNGNLTFLNQMVFMKNYCKKSKKIESFFYKKIGPGLNLISGWNWIQMIQIDFNCSFHYINNICS